MRFDDVGMACGNGVCGQAGMGNSVVREKRARALLELAGRDEYGGDVKREMERDVNGFWARELGAQEQ